MRHLSVLSKLCILLGAIVVAMGLLIGGQLWGLRKSMLAEREVKLHDMVAGVVALAGYYDGEVKAGHLSLDEAQALVAKAARAERWGKDDYYTIYREDGLTIVHGNPKYEGQMRIDFADATGLHTVAELIKAAQAGGGTLKPAKQKP